jgi:hypothetical protein
MHLQREASQQADRYLRWVGFTLVDRGQDELWRVVFIQYVREFWGSNYVLGDETLFLVDKPTSAQDGYEGPPAYRMNSAVERAAQSRAGHGADGRTEHAR